MSFTPSTRGDYKSSARVASVGNITISAPGATIDGVTMVVGDRVLLKDQSAGAENGIYEWEGSAVPMRRAPDANQSGELTSGLMVTIEEGSTHPDTTWILTTNDPVTIDTTALAFEQISVGTLDSLSDVDTTGVTDGSLLRYEATGTVWEDTASNLLLTDAGQLQVTTNGSAGGILFGADANLYRSAANVLTSDTAIRSKTNVQALSDGGGAPYMMIKNSLSAQRSHFYMRDADAGWHQWYAGDGGDALLFTPSVAGVDQANTVKFTTAGQVQLPISGSGAGLLLGGDALLYRAAANDARFATGDSLTLDAGIGKFAKLAGTSSDTTQLLRVYDTDGTPGTIFEINETGRTEWGAPASGTLDTILGRSAAGELELTVPVTQSGAKLHIKQNVGVAGDAILELSAAGASNDSTVQLQNVTLTSSTTAGNRLTATATDGIYLPSATAATTGLILGGDANLYRSAANLLRTDDSFYSIGTNTAVAGFIANNAAGTNSAYRARIPGDAQDYFFIRMDGTHYWGDRTNPQDTGLYRPAADTLAMVLGDQFQVQQDPTAQNDVTRRSYVDHRAWFLGG